MVLIGSKDYERENFELCNNVDGKLEGRRKIIDPFIRFHRQLLDMSNPCLLCTWCDLQTIFPTLSIGWRQPDTKWVGSPMSLGP